MKSLSALNNITLEHTFSYLSASDHAPFQQTCGKLFVVGNDCPLTIKKKKKKEMKVVEEKREPSLSPKAVRNMLHEFVRGIDTSDCKRLNGQITRMNQKEMPSKILKTTKKITSMRMGKQTCVLQNCLSVF